tara:strand:- start:135 stop:668 length:534 start_codon:yes stop_codon:yes gene_type:complete
MRKQDLSNYKLPLNWERGNNVIFEAIWVVLFRPIVSSFLPGSYWRKIILIIFGAKLGKNIRFNCGLKVKFPWKLIIGNFCWIGEDTWIDNLETVKISDNVCISQGVYFCSGNHNYKKSTFDLICKPILIESNVWIGAKSIIGPGYTVGKSSVVTLGSIVKEDIPSNCLFNNGEKSYF